MFRWVFNLKTKNEIQIVDFFLSAVCFLSIFGSFLAPFPLLYAYRRLGRGWGFFLILTNLACVGLCAGKVSFLIYLFFVVILTVFLSEFLLRVKSVEKSVIFTLLGMLFTGFLFMGVYAGIYGLHFFQSGYLQLNQFFDSISQSIFSSSLSSRSHFMTPSEFHEWKETEMLALPSTIVIAVLLLIIINIALLLRKESKIQTLSSTLNLEKTVLQDKNGVHFSCKKSDTLGIAEPISFHFQNWKVWEYLIWPTLVSIFFLIFDVRILSGIALNTFRFLMTIYAIQGLSILSYFFTTYGMRELSRILTYLLFLLFMLPVVLCLGFFDLWFDFRKKFKQV